MRCPVKNCSTTQNKNPNNLSAFSVTAERKVKWKEILKCDFKSNSRVSEKHFSPNDIIKNYIMESNGMLLAQVSLFILQK